jgi:hypothetical protein
MTSKLASARSKTVDTDFVNGMGANFVIVRILLRKYFRPAGKRRDVWGQWSRDREPFAYSRDIA